MSQINRRSSNRDDSRSQRLRFTESLSAQECSRGRDPSYLLGISAFVSVAAGSLKGTPLFAWLPIDLFLIAFIACLLILPLTIRHKDGFPLEIALISALAWFGLLSGLVIGFEGEKIVFVFAATPLMIVVGIALGVNRTGLIGIADSATAIGVLTCFGLVLFPAETGELGRWTLEGANQIDTARMLGFAALAALTRPMLRRARMSHWWIWAGLFGAFVFFLLMTGSRGPVVAFVAAIVVLTLVRKGLLKSLQIFALGLVGVPLLLITPLSSSVLDFPLFRRLTEGSEVTDFTSGRDTLFQSAFNAMITNPMGVGWGRYSDYVATTEGIGEAVYAHNLLLEVGAESGWIGLTTFTLFLLLVAYCCHKIWYVPLAALAVPGIVYWFGAAMFSSDFGGNRGLWLMVGVVFGVYWKVVPRYAKRGAVRSPSMQKAV